MSTNDFDSIDPTAALDWTRPLERLRCEYQGAKMAAKGLTLAQKLWTSLFLLGWFAWTGAWLTELITQNNILIGVYGIYTAIVFSLLMSIHNIKMDEIRRFAQLNISFGSSDDDE